MIAPIKYWNPDIVVEVTHDLEKPIVPQLLVEFGTFHLTSLALDHVLVELYSHSTVTNNTFYLANGESKKLDIKGVHVDAIKANLFALDAARRPGASATENATATL